MRALLFPFSRFGKRESQRGRAGFTLVELMVAMTGGLFVSIAVLALSRDASRFYQRETRVGNATLASTTGFERLSGDLARAGHLTTANITNDPRVCNRPLVSWPAMVQSLRAVTITTTAAQVAGTEVASAGITPMTIQIAGALESIEELTTTVITNAGGVTSIAIRLDTPAAARIGLVAAPAAAATNVAILSAIFVPGGVGRVVRIAQLDGMEQYGIVSAVQANPERLILAAAPVVQFRSSATAAQCGVLGYCTGCSVNVVNFVRYQLRPMTNFAPYASLFQASGVGGSSNVLPFEQGRVELVREELDSTGAAIANTVEIVAEYAVDLQFRVIQATSATDTTLIDVPPGNLTPTYAFTQLVRGIHARLAVRSREPDRLGSVAGTAPGEYRIPLSRELSYFEDDGTAVPHARVRSLQSDIPLRNLEGANW